MVSELAEADDCELFDMAYHKWSLALHKHNQLWLKLAANVETIPADWWNIEKGYRPAKRPDIEAAIEAKEAELDEMLAGFFRLSPQLQDRANKAMEALQAEINELRAEVEDLSAPWQEAVYELAERYRALDYAASLTEEDGPRRAEALRRVVDKIVCHFRYVGHRSIIDTVEVHPATGDVVCFTNGVKPGRASLPR